MQAAPRPADTNRRLFWTIAIIVVILLVLFILAILAIVFAILRAMASTDASVCGLAAVRSSPAASALLGTPIAQHGFTTGSTSSENGELTQRMTFTVGGPRGRAFVVSEGQRSPLASHLSVKMGRDQHSITVYSGPFDCPQLHRS